MASFPFCSILRDHAKGEKKGFLDPVEVLRWRSEQDGRLPKPRDDEVVILASFCEYDFSHPYTHSCGDTLLLWVGDLTSLSQHHPPHSVFHCFVRPTFMWPLTRNSRSTYSTCDYLLAVVVSSTLAASSSNCAPVSQRDTSKSRFHPPFSIMRASGFMSRT